MPNKVLLGLLLCNGVLSATAIVFSSEWVTDPIPQHFNELARKVRRVDLHSMVPKRVTNFKSENDKPLLVMEYPAKEETVAVDHAVGAAEGWETQESVKLCNLYRKEGSVGNILDVGAKIGAYTLPLASCLRQRGLVLAVEGVPPLADHLRAGIVADNATNVALYPYSVTKALVSNIATVHSKGSDAQEYKVPLTTADAMLRTNPAMKALMLAKIELEGEEGLFLEGAQEMFTKFPPCYLTIEFLSEELQLMGTPLQSLLRQLKKWGYRTEGRLSMPTHQEVAEQHFKTYTIAYGESNSAEHAQCIDRVKQYSF